MGIDIESIISQLKALATNPKGVWDDIAAADFELEDIFWPWVFLLGAVQGIFLFLGMAIAGAFAVKWLFAPIGAVVGAVFVAGFVANMVAPKFEGEQDLSQAMRLMAFAYTPLALFHVFFILFRFVPSLASIGWSLGSIATCVYIYFGCGPCMKIPDDMSKKITFTAVSALPIWFISMPF